MTNTLNDKRIKFFLFFLAFTLYANTIGHDYAWDDSIVITENTRVKKGISGIPDLFLKYNSDYKADKYGYRPIVLSSFALEYALFKEKPAIGHLMNVIYFALLCCVMFVTLRRIFNPLSNLAPFLATLIFLVHPVHVEVVANIKSRDEIFALLFSLLSLQQLLSFNSSKKIKQLFYFLLLYLAAFLSKENAITFLAIFPLTLFYVNGTINLKKIIVPGIWILVIGSISLLITKSSATSDLGKLASKGAGIYYENGILGNSFFHTSLISGKLANALTILMFYLKNFLYPSNLHYFYGFNQIPVANWGQPLVWTSLLVHILLIGFAIFRYKTHRELGYGIAFYFITISVYTHVFKTLADTMADRFLFMPSMGLCIALVFGLASLLRINLIENNLDDVLLLFKGKKQNNTKRMPSLKKISYLVFITCALFSLKTFSRNKAWKNNETLIKTDMTKLDNCARAHNYYADILKSKLKSNYNTALEAEMIDHYQKSIQISRESYYSFLGLGTYYCDQKRYEEGIAVLDSMVNLFPEQADPHFFLGQAFYQTQNYLRAISHLETSLVLAPEVLNTYYFLALAYSKNKESEKALQLVERAKKKFSETGSLYDALGNIYFDSGDCITSAKYTLEMLRFGENPQRVYGVVIGRFQANKQDSLAGVYYREAVSKGVFRPGTNGMH